MKVDRQLLLKMINDKVGQLWSPNNNGQKFVDIDHQKTVIGIWLTTIIEKQSIKGSQNGHKKWSTKANWKSQQQKVKRMFSDNDQQKFVDNDRQKRSLIVGQQLL